MRPDNSACDHKGKERCQSSDASGTESRGSGGETKASVTPTSPETKTVESELVQELRSRAAQSKLDSLRKRLSVDFSLDLSEIAHDLKDQVLSAYPGATGPERLAEALRQMQVGREAERKATAVLQAACKAALECIAKLTPFPTGNKQTDAIIAGVADHTDRVRAQLREAIAEAERLIGHDAKDY
jgi:hypothetical protein